MVVYTGWDLTFYELIFFSVKLGKPHVYFPDNVEKAQKSFCTAKLLSVNNDLIAFLNFQRDFEAVKTFLIF